MGLFDLLILIAQNRYLFGSDSNRTFRVATFIPFLDLHSAFDANQRAIADFYYLLSHLSPARQLEIIVFFVESAIIVGPMASD
jgi:hypothetical protein